MKKRIGVLLSLLALNVVLSAGAQEAEKKKSESDAMMEFYVEQAKPVADHQRLAEFSGPWKVTSKFWFAPGEEPQISSGSGNGQMILGGRFMSFDTKLKGAFNSESLTLFGFDRRTGNYTMIGLDTLGTYYITAEGKWDEAKKAVTLHGSYLQPPANTDQKYHFVWTTPSPREHLMTLFFNMGGKDMQVAEMRFTRE